ncbi:MAG: hypothetical protein KatS3mg110_1464 [Pirellulaceae bacterium]|nr:MAG: hypothetical protein KatS3mg110_1464 [Pirellulaceae bacterium]
MKMRIVAVDVLAATGFVSLLLAFVLLWTNAAYAECPNCYQGCANGGGGATVCTTDPVTWTCTQNTAGRNCDAANIACTCVPNLRKCVCAN